MYSVLVLFLSFVLWIASEKTLLHFRQAAAWPAGRPIARPIAVSALPPTFHGAAQSVQPGSRNVMTSNA